MTIPDRKTLADGMLALLILAGIAWVHTAALFDRPEWVDWIAYALPAANLVDRGVLATPQLGSQAGLDRYWLWNSPWMGAGPALMYWPLGVSREAYLAGALLQDLAVLAAFVILARRALGLRSWTLAALVAAALLTTRSYLGELYNQRYTPLAFLALTILFLPPPSPRPSPSWWRWLLAGVLPLIHPALVIASAVWVAAEAIRWARLRRRDAPIQFPAAGLALFALGVVACGAWYLRRDPLTLQFLPQTRGASGRPGWGVAASWIAAAPTWATYALILLAALIGAAGAGRAGPDAQRGRRAIVALAAVLLLDLAVGFGYLHFYLLGLALPILGTVRDGPFRVPAIAALVLLATAHVGVMSRLDALDPEWIGPSAARNYIVRHTRPGDRIVLGPPFVLAASEPELPGRRRVRYVVPLPYMIRHTFDAGRFRREIRDRTDVYLGEPRFFHTVEAEKSFLPEPSWRRDPELRPLYPRAAVAFDRFADTEICVARSVATAAAPSRPTAAGTTGRRE